MSTTAKRYQDGERQIGASSASDALELIREERRNGGQRRDEVYQLRQALCELVGMDPYGLLEHRLSGFFAYILDHVRLHEYEFKQAADFVKADSSKRGLQ